MFKELIAGDWTSFKMLWETSEDPIPRDELQWIFGFDVPHSGADYRQISASKPPIPGPERQPRPQYEDGLEPVEQSELELEKRRLDTSKSVLQSREGIKIRKVSEAWNPADAEMWRFIRAIQGRSQLARKTWEREEAGFAGSQDHRSLT